MDQRQTEPIRSNKALHQGVRIAKDGTPFRISGAAVWMVVVEGATHARATLFRK